MNVLVSSAGRFVMTNDGVLWGPPSLEYKLWRRYLEVFDQVRLVARTDVRIEVPEGWKKASGEGVQPVPLPYFVGPQEFIRVLPRLKRAIWKELENAEAVILRLPCSIGGLIRRSLVEGRPYGVEVLGDPYDVFAPGAVRHFLRIFFRWLFPRQLRQQCASACAVAYVTAETLQRRYPPGHNAFSTHFSSIELLEEDFISQPRCPRRNGAFTLITVGSLQQLYKGTDLLIEAVHKSSALGLNLRLAVVGDGKHRSELQASADKLCLGEHVHFLGELPSGAAVRHELDRADLFVLPSRAEGLPRAMIEAMSRGLPCIGSRVGGIPELLTPEDMVQPGDARALADKIHEVVTNPDRMQAMSARNLALAQRYRDDVLRQRRILLYEHLMRETNTWFSRS